MLRYADGGNGCADPLPRRLVTLAAPPQRLPPEQAAGGRLSAEAAYPSPLPSDTQGRRSKRECRTYGSVRGARSNARPYRDLSLIFRLRPLAQRAANFDHPPAGVLTGPRGGSLHTFRLTRA